MVKPGARWMYMVVGQFSFPWFTILLSPTIPLSQLEKVLHRKIAEMVKVPEFSLRKIRRRHNRVRHAHNSPCCGKPTAPGNPAPEWRVTTQPPEVQFWVERSSGRHRRVAQCDDHLIPDQWRGGLQAPYVQRLEGSEVHSCIVCLPEKRSRFVAGAPPDPLAPGSGRGNDKIPGSKGRQLAECSTSSQPFLYSGR